MQGWLEGDDSTIIKVHTRGEVDSCQMDPIIRVNYTVF